MQGHTATDPEQLKRLYEVIFPNMDAGTYSEPVDIEEAIEQAEAAKIIKTAAAVGGIAPAASGLTIQFLSKVAKQSLIDAGFPTIDALRAATDEELLKVIDAKALASVRKAAPFVAA